MKSLKSLAVIMALSVTWNLNAKPAYGSAGCGLGSVLFSADTKLFQILAGTTNGTYYNQTFGISSGTSNCTNSGIVKAEKEQEVFITANFESLESEIATGKGEKLNAFASLMGCKQNGAFHQVARKNYTQMFQKEEATPVSVLSFMKEEIKKNEALKTSCTI